MNQQKIYYCQNEVIDQNTKSEKCVVTKEIFSTIYPYSKSIHAAKLGGGNILALATKSVNLISGRQATMAKSDEIEPALLEVR